MPLRFSCPHCDQHFSAERENYGTRITCPTCHTEFIVPNPEVSNSVDSFPASPAPPEPTCPEKPSTPTAPAATKSVPRKKRSELRKARHYLIFLDNLLQGPFTIPQLQEMWRSGKISSVTPFTIPGYGSESLEPLAEILDLIVEYQPTKSVVFAQRSQAEADEAGELLPVWWPDSKSGGVFFAFVLAWTFIPHFVIEGWLQAIQSLVCWYGLGVVLRYVLMVGPHNWRVRKFNALKETRVASPFLSPFASPRFYEHIAFNAFVALVVYCFITVAVTRVQLAIEPRLHPNSVSVGQKSSGLGHLQLHRSLNLENILKAAANEVLRLSQPYLGDPEWLRRIASKDIGIPSESSDLRRVTEQNQKMTLFSFGLCVLALCSYASFRCHAFNQP